MFKANDRVLVRTLNNGAGPSAIARRKPLAVVEWNGTVIQESVYEKGWWLVKKDRSRVYTVPEREMRLAK